MKTTHSKTSYFIGLMSGTSLDGIDVVLCKIASSNEFEFLNANTYPMPSELKKNLLLLSQKKQSDELERYAMLDVQMGQLFAECCLALMEQNGIKAEQVSAIGSHGQTLRHYPDKTYPTTLQIGDPNIIAQVTNITTIADFRRRDIAAGGQGAPLVPPFHKALFKSNALNRTILNIGGIANITFLPSADESVIGYDTGPGNGLMDDWCIRYFNCAYDHSGQLASQGNVNEELLMKMLDDPFFSQTAPKSTGREYFSYQWIEKQLIEIGQTRNGISPADVLKTLLELSCLSITNEINALNPNVDEVLICGGGIKNVTLIQRLKALMPNIKVYSTEQFGLHPDWVEASAFAWLAHQTLNSKPANLPSVTGANHKVILGAIWPAFSRRE